MFDEPRETKRTREFEAGRVIERENKTIGRKSGRRVGRFRPRFFPSVSPESTIRRGGGTEVTRFV